MCDVSRRLRRLALGLAFGLGSPAIAGPVISEIMASNKTTLADGDGDFSDWIEIYNPDPESVDLTGWYLSDNAANKTKWQFPAVSLPSHEYLVVFASDKNRRDPSGELHTNFALSADGEYLGLTRPDGVTVASEFAPSFPPQTADVAYGLDNAGGEAPARAGFLRVPTPRAPNSGLGLRERVQITPGSRAFTEPLFVSLEGAGPGQSIRYDLVGPSPGGIPTSDPTPTSTLYTGPFPVTSSTVVRAAVFSEDGLARGASSSALFVSVSGNGASGLDGFSSRLPIVVLDDHGFGPLEKSQGRKRAWLQLYAPTEDLPASLSNPPVASGPADINVRGSTSAAYPKKSYSIELQDDLGAGRSLSLLGLANSSDWALVAPWSFDPSYLRNALVYALSNRIGRWAPRTRFVEVFFKTGGDALDATHHAGLSVLTERIKIGPDLVAITPLDPSSSVEPAITGGYILKFDPADDDEYGWTTDHGFPRDEGPGAGTLLVVASPKAAKLPPAQRDYIRTYVQRFENVLFADRESNWETRRYLDYVDRASWIDFHLLQVLAKNPDGLARSAYFTKDRGGKLKAGPLWDFDRAMGSADPRSQRWDEWNETTQATSFWTLGWWGVLAHDPDFMQAWIDRWQALRGEALSSATLSTLATALAEQIDPAAAERDVARWPANAPREGDSFRAEVERLVDWLTHRAQWIDQQFIAPPIAVVADGARRIVAPPGMKIAYTLDGSDPRALGGTLATSATLTSEPLLLGNATYAVRIYDPSAETAFPGSPWSARVTLTGTGGSPPPGSNGPPPAPQLINLATRGRVDAEHLLACGLAVTGDAPKRYLIRAVGPALGNFGVSDPLSDPVLRVLAANGAEIARNDDWRRLDDRAAVIEASLAVGAFGLPETSRDAALLVTLSAGNYTIQVSSATGGHGTALAELYALDAMSAGSNLSARAFLGPGESLIGGITLAGSTPGRVLVRAIGPSLAKFGVADALPDPLLAFHSGSTLLASNDDWTFASNASDIASAAAAAGAFALDPGTKDSAVLITVNPGSYTLQLRAKEEGGSALLEIYQAP